MGDKVEDLMLLDKLVDSAPTLVVLVFVVWIFLKQMAKRDEVLRDIGDRCHEVQRESVAAINANSLALGKNGQALEAVNFTLKRVNGL